MAFLIFFVYLQAKTWFSAWHIVVRSDSDTGLINTSASKKSKVRNWNTSQLHLHTFWIVFKSYAWGLNTNYNMCNFDIKSSPCAWCTLCSGGSRDLLQKFREHLYWLDAILSKQSHIPLQLGEMELQNLLLTSPFIPTRTWCTQCYEVQSRVQSFWLLWQLYLKLTGWIFPFHAKFVWALLFDCTLDKMWTTCHRSPWEEEKPGLKESLESCPSSPPSPTSSSLELFLLIIWNPY